jgi:hypothetical protein
MVVVRVCFPPSSAALAVVNVIRRLRTTWRHCVLKFFPWVKADGLPAQLQSESQIPNLEKLIYELQRIAVGQGLSSVMGIMEGETIPDQHLLGSVEMQISNQTDGSYLLQVYQELTPKRAVIAHRNSDEMIEAHIPPVETI